MPLWIGNRPLPAQVVEGPHGLLGQHVYVLPALVVGARLDEGHVEATVAATDFPEAVEITGVAAEEDVEIPSADDPRRPQRAVTVVQAAAGEVLGRVAVS